MLSDTEKKEIEATVQHAETQRSACVDALLIVQRHRGWVSDEALADVAAALEMSTAELDSIATFYNLIFRKPVGKHVVHVCDGISCWIMGGHAVRDRVRERLGIRAGETTEDGEITFLPADCMGACDRAPTMIVDQTLYGNVTPEKVDEILDELGGKKV
jgi:NADH-quinone oxidoreductase subunit E